MKVLLVCAFLGFHHVIVEAYRLPIPYGTGVQDKTRLKRLSVHDREIRYILGLFETFGTV